jgi:hypothetical protein
MNNFICSFCKKEFKTISLLKRHETTAKYCLKLQSKNINDINNNKILQCEYCNKILSTNQVLKSHYLICKEKILINKDEEVIFIKKERDEELLKKDEEIQILRKEKDDKNLLISKLDTKLKIITEKTKEQIDNYKEQIEEYKEQIYQLQDRLERMGTKAIEKPTTTTTPNNTINKIQLNTFPSQQEINNKIEGKFNDVYILNGMKGVVDFVYENIIKLEDGNVVYACYDRARQMFKYKDKDGNEIKDPKAMKLRKMIKPGLLAQTNTMLKYFNDECEYLDRRKDNGLEIDDCEYNKLNHLREKILELGFEISNINDTNKFTNNLADLTC